MLLQASSLMSWGRQFKVCTKFNQVRFLCELIELETLTATDNKRLFAKI